MSDTALTLEKVLEEVGFTARMEAKAEARGFAIGEAKGLVIGEAKGLVIGEAKGLAIGEIKGEAKGKEEIARNMLKSGFPVEQVAELSGLDVERIKALVP